MPQDVIFDLLPVAEIRPIREHINTMIKATTLKKSHHKDRAKRASKYFKHNPLLKLAPTVHPKWKPNPHPELADCTTFVMKHMPADVSLVCDPIQRAL